MFDNDHFAQKMIVGIGIEEAANLPKSAKTGL